MDFPITLDKTYLNHSPKKFYCPSCGKKRFVRFYNAETNEYLPDEFGRCDREESCGYFLAPTKDYYKQSDNLYHPHIKTVKKPSLSFKNKNHYLPQKYLDYSFQPLQNDFLEAIASHFGERAMQKVQKQFYIGNSSYWNGATIFWQIDELQHVRTGKIMLYDNSLKRVKTPISHIQWVHTVLKKENELPQDFSLKQCFFGQHQLTDKDATIVIVESAKTAILGWLWMPQYIWLSAEGKQGLNLEKASILAKRKVIFMPDFSDECRDLWELKAYEIEEMYHTHSSMSAIGNDISDGSDLADLILNSPEIIRSLKMRYF